MSDSVLQPEVDKSLSFAVLSSGSKANCSVVCSGSDRVLIDCGLSCRRTEERLRQSGIAPETISAVVITHEHSDHVGGLRVFARKYAVPVHIVSGVERTGNFAVFSSELKIRHFRAGESFSVGQLEFQSYSIHHDALDPVAFRINAHGRSIAFITDLGQVTELIRYAIRDVDALVLEFNHDRGKLMSCSYPWEIKQRIAGRMGHLSNDDAAELMVQSALDSTRVPQVVVAAHISENSNCPEIVLGTMQAAWKRSGIEHTPRFFAGSVAEPLPLISLDRIVNRVLPIEYGEDSPLDDEKIAKFGGMK
ncbi:MAG: MBL fold metallo-hydrolase [bacterium]|nr:MBL fold metallo-hydrolase [bacterium]